MPGTTAQSSGNRITNNSHQAPVAIRVLRMKEVAEHWSATSCWMVIADNVYDVTDFVNQHPGGCDILLEHGGRDVTVPFSDVAHSIDAQVMLQAFFIGVLHEDDRIHKKVATGLICK